MKKRLYTMLLILIALFSLSGQGQDQKINYLKSVDSFDKLLEKFKGQVIYIDFWASTCSSCLRAFNHKTELDSFFQDNNIIMLYIALEKETFNSDDEKKSILKWQRIVEKYNLTGYNYYTQLKTDFFWDISSQIMGRKLHLPRFAIVNKNSVIVERNAKWPTDNEKLITQLKKYLDYSPQPKPE